MLRPTQGAMLKYSRSGTYSVYRQESSPVNQHFFPIGNSPSKRTSCLASFNLHNLNTMIRDFQSKPQKSQVLFDHFPRRAGDLLDI